MKCLGSTDRVHLLRRLTPLKFGLDIALSVMLKVTQQGVSQGHFQISLFMGNSVLGRLGSLHLAMRIVEKHFMQSHVNSRTHRSAE